MWNSSPKNIQISKELVIFCQYENFSITINADFKEICNIKPK